MEGSWVASMRRRGHPRNQEERSHWIQKRLDHLEKIKGLEGWSSDKKEEWRKTARIALRIEYDEGSESDEEEEDEGLRASTYRDRWNLSLSKTFSFEDTTIIPAMRFIDPPIPPEARPRTTIQVFSAKIVGLSGGLQFPLHVHGVIAARDCIDRRRNVIFNRSRNNCQTTTEENPYLVLTGPSRAVVLHDPVIIEVILKVKGADESEESEDKILHFQVIRLVRVVTGHSRMIHGPSTSKLSTLELSLGSIDSSVEASISIKCLTDFLVCLSSLPVPATVILPPATLSRMTLIPRSSYLIHVAHANHLDLMAALIFLVLLFLCQ